MNYMKVIFLGVPKGCKIRFDEKPLDLASSGFSPFKAHFTWRGTKKVFKLSQLAS